MRTRIFVMLLMSWAIVTSANASCTHFSSDKVLAVTNTLSQLLKINDVAPEDGEVEKTTSKLVVNFKNTLITAVSARLACEAGVDIDIASLQAELNKSLTVNNADESAIYAYNLNFDVQKLKGNPNLLAVHINFGIPCGDDNVLIIYRFRNGAWHQDLRWQSEEYSMISGAHGSWYDYLVLDDTQSDEPLLAIVHGTPWCTSAWSRLVVDVVKLSNSNKAQQLLFTNSVGYYIGADDATLKPTPKGFELRFDINSIDSDILVRIGVFRYQVVGDMVVRIQPFASNARDFVDEWITVGSETAQRLSDPQEVQNLMAVHKSLQSRYGYYGAVQRCQTQAKEQQYQVQMTFNGAQRNDPEEIRYFTVKAIENGFIMSNSSTSANPSCTGADIMQNNSSHL